VTISMSPSSVSLTSVTLESLSSSWPLEKSVNSASSRATMNATLTSKRLATPASGSSSCTAASGRVRCRRAKRMAGLLCLRDFQGSRRGLLLEQAFGMEVERFGVGAHPALLRRGDQIGDDAYREADDRGGEGGDHVAGQRRQI